MTVLFPAIAILLLGCQLVFTNELAKDAGKFHELDEKIEVLTDLNNSLVWQIASASALPAVAEKSKVLGFVEPKQTISFPRDYTPVAFNSR